MSRAGIRYGDLRVRHGVDSLPWRIDPEQGCQCQSV